MAKDTDEAPEALKFLARVKAYVKRKPCATYDDIADSLRTTSANVKICFKTAKLKYKGNLKPPKIGDAALARRSETARLILRHMDPSGGNKTIVMDKVSFITSDLMNNHACRSILMFEDEPDPSPAFCREFERNRDPRPDHYLIWQAMTSDGSVSPFVIKMNKIDAKEYVEECLRKVLVPWLKQNYKLEDVLLWPDLCPRQNSATVYKFLDAEKISYVKKSDNAPKLTHARPIEFCSDKCKEKYRFHALLKEAKDLEDFRKIYTEINAEVMEKYAKERCAEIPENLKAIQKGYM